MGEADSEITYDFIDKSSRDRDTSSRPENTLWVFFVFFKGRSIESFWENWRKKNFNVITVLNPYYWKLIVEEENRRNRG